MSFSAIAPIKLNLFLHVTGKLDSGYHTLESFVCFGNAGDTITIKENEKFSFTIKGDFANQISTDDNLIITAIKNFTGQKTLPLISIELEKNIPIGAGLGGGSSDAATIIKLLQQANIPQRKDMPLNKILTLTGADVPICYHAQSAYMHGIGEYITPISPPNTLHAVLIYPNEPSVTKDIFEMLRPPYNQSLTLQDKFLSQEDLFQFLKEQRNNLTAPAIKIRPSIQKVLDSLQNTKPILSRMSGSGSTCFAIYRTEQQANDMAYQLQQGHQNWWVKYVSVQ